MFGSLFSSHQQELLDHQSWTNRNKRPREGACWLRGHVARVLLLEKKRRGWSLRKRTGWTPPPNP